MRYHDNQRKAEYSNCYAKSARSTLLSATLHLRDMKEATTLFQWKVAYKAAIISCRSALHIFHKKDAPRSIYLEKALEKRFLIWKKSEGVAHPFQLLEAERNSLLKEGQSIWPLECINQFDKEPRFLLGDRFITGSDAVSDILSWIMTEIETIEDAAFGCKKEQKITSSK
ncbi:hypothetical protein ACQU0X_22260 [Pseudovibrio ascidiaceicola]|uniref:hypothetical protein n=1 Tax=Pseudovibrio ascidiaceicola TaxID=285279 RepID=UPI003D3618FD